MSYKLRFAGSVLAALPMLTSIVPALAQEGEIALAKGASVTFGVQGVAPEGWTEVGLGVYARGQGATDLARLIIQAAPGMTAGVLCGQLGLDALSSFELPLRELFAVLAE